MYTRILPLIAFCLLAACSADNAQSPDDALPVFGTPEPGALVTADNEFGVDLLKQVHKPGDNVAVSPLSASMALQMAAVGARGETLREMRDVMHVGDVDLAASNQALLADLGKHESVRLEVANSLWADPKLTAIDPAYTKTLREFFSAEARERSFGDPATREEINAWVSKRTNEKIPELLEDIPAGTVAYLINAVYLKGAWQKAFDESLTMDAPFHAPGGDVTVKMMERKEGFEAYDDAGTGIARIPMGPKGEASMWFALPAWGSDAASLLEGFSVADLERWRKLDSRRVEKLRLPRFKLKSRSDLIPGLKKLGMKRAFGGGADFSGIDPRLFISEVLQEVVVEVNETGAEAAAATAVGFESKSIPIELAFDRPFLFLITDDVSGAILFAGVFYGP